MKKYIYKNNRNGKYYRMLDSYDSQLVYPTTSYEVNDLKDATIFETESRDSLSNMPFFKYYDIISYDKELRRVKLKKINQN